MERLDNVAPQEVEHHEDYYAYCMDCAEILTENRSENIAEIYAGDHCSVFGHQVMVARSMRESNPQM